MGKKSIINAIKQIEMDSGSWDDDQLEQVMALVTNVGELGKDN